MSAPVVVNGRYRGQPMSGVQRYAAELVSRLGSHVDLIGPPAAASGLRGHLWEQLLLPRISGSSLLWSPCNTGPLAQQAQVVTVHDLATIDHPEWFTRRFAGFYRWLLPRLLPRVRALITVSAFTRRRLLDCLPLDPRRIHVIHPGVSPGFAPAPRQELEAALARLGLTGHRYVLSLATSEPRKNLPRLVAAFQSVRPHLPPDVKLVLAGHAGGTHLFRRTAPAPPGPGVIHLGYVKEADLRALYSAALAFVFPSLYEGFGMPPLEAMACGAPVIASDAAALPEVLGPAARYCPAGDVAAIGRAIRDVCESALLRQDLSGRGREHAARFCWNRAAGQTWDLLRSAA